ncbi:MAG: AAA family ATPase [Thermodesulfovibrio sp.]|nr:AAA family ATPase [Thermodesulfovibrio sp.]
MVKIVITNRKGGTGKTTVAVNLSAELSARGKKFYF